MDTDTDFSHEANEGNEENLFTTETRRHRDSNSSPRTTRNGLAAWMRPPSRERGALGWGTDGEETFGQQEAHNAQNPEGLSLQNT
jgi:hypothetical protein